MLNELIPEALKWSVTHACRFDVGKFQLVHFTRNRNKKRPLPLQVGEHIIVPESTAKYLGIILDAELRFHEQVEAASAKGAKTLGAIGRLTKPSFGLPHKYVRTLVRAVLLP
ncbi:hypothetical protein CPB85DRAFT_1232394, partial [Mucidula mucida]